MAAIWISDKKNNLDGLGIFTELGWTRECLLIDYWHFDFVSNESRSKLYQYNQIIFCYFNISNGSLKTVLE